MEKKIVLITGTSSGFGFLAALELAKKNYFVIATMRDIRKKDNLMCRARELQIEHNIDVVKLDVTNDEDILEIVKYVQKNVGKINILINNAGYSLGGLIEFTDLQDWKNQFETNVYSVIALTKAFIPMMREKREGKIINLGSISGRIAFPGMAPYAASKFALEGFSESLRLELLPFNINVSLIEAGSYKTAIWEKGLEKVKESGHDDYKVFFNKIYNHAYKTSQNAADPMDVIRLITKICDKKNPKFRYQIGKGIKLVILLKSILPWHIFEWFIKRKLYTK